VIWYCDVTGFPNAYWLPPVIAESGVTGFCANGSIAAGGWNWTPNIVASAVTFIGSGGVINTWQNCTPLGTCQNAPRQGVLC